MTIRLRYYLAILPLFLGLGLANAVLFFFLEKNEVEWGLQQRVTSTALAIAHFAPTANTPEALVKGLNDYGRRLEGLTVVRHTPEGAGWRSEILLSGEGLVPAPPPSPEQAARLAAGEVVEVFIAHPQGAFDEHIAYARVGTPTATGAPVPPEEKKLSNAVTPNVGTPRAVGGATGTGATGATVVTASSLTGPVYAVTLPDLLRRAEMDLLLRKGIYFMLSLLVLGVLTAEFLTRWALREISALVEVASSLASGNYGFHWQPGRIRELIDLGGTLETMASIFRESIQQTKRGFFQAELLPGDRELAGTLQSFCDAAPAGGTVLASVQFRRLGQDTWEDFFGTRATSDGTDIVVGRLSPPPAGATRMERILRANAARDYFLGVLSATASVSAETWRELEQLFGCQLAYTLHVPEQGLPTAQGFGEVALLAFVPGAAGESPGGLGRDLVGTLTPAALRRARHYLQQFPRHDLHAAADELVTMLQRQESGILVCFDFSQHSQPLIKSP